MDLEDGLGKRGKIIDWKFIRLLKTGDRHYRLSSFLLGEVVSIFTGLLAYWLTDWASICEWETSMLTGGMFVGGMLTDGMMNDDMLYDGMLIELS